MESVEKGEKGKSRVELVQLLGGRTGQMLSDLASPATATLLPCYPARPGPLFLATNLEGKDTLWLLHSGYRKYTEYRK